MVFHETYMKTAIELAKKGEGYVSPNPLVGAVIVKDDIIIGSGYHTKYGGLHAEREALKNCRTSPKGASMYVTLEPCSHYGKQPPCTLAIIESGIDTVYIGSSDPNPEVNGKGIQVLRDANIKVVTGLLKEECDSLNTFFFHYIATNRPYVTLKFAMTIDGKIASHSGKSQWITGESARAQVHRDRKRYQAIMVGVGTVFQDNPVLNCRTKENPVNPIRIICDTKLRTPMNSKIVQTSKEIPTYLATCCTDKSKHSPYEMYGCSILVTKQQNGHIDLNDLMQQLGKIDIDSLFVEGGGTLNWSLLQENLVNHIQCYIGNKVLGGQSAKTAILGTGFDTPNDSPAFKLSNIMCFDEDILLEYDIIT